MAIGVSGRLTAATSAFGAVFRSRNLALLEAAWTVSVAATWVFLVGALIVAYQTAGAAGVAAVGVARMLPAALAGPLLVLAERRLPADRLLVATHATRVAAVAIAAVMLLAGAPALAILPVVALEAIFGVFARPIDSNLIPALATAPEELVGANVVSSTGEGIGMLVGPAIGGLVAAAWGPLAVCAVAIAALLVALGCAALLRVPADALPGPTVDATPSVLRAGIVALRARPAARLVMLCFGAQVVVRGALSVLIVVASIDLLGLGDSGVGLLNAAIGAGGFIGALVALGIAGSARIAVPFALALVGWGLPIALVGVAPLPAVAIALLVTVGASNAVLDVAGFTLLQRLVPNAQRGAVFGLLESIGGAGLALGSVVAPASIWLLGPRGALVLVGAALPVLALVAWPRLRRLDEEIVIPARELALLRAMPMFAPLPMTVIERLAGRLARVELPPGALLTRQGDQADCFYAVEQGEIEVLQDGRLLRTCGPLTAVGEIALLRRVPRTATVRATVPTVAFALEGDDFVAAVTGNPRSVSAADVVIDGRLAFDARDALRTLPQMAAAPAARAAEDPPASGRETGAEAAADG